MANDDFDDAMNRKDEQERRSTEKCQCGYPDWPGKCPGPSRCPCVLDDETEDRELLAAIMMEDGLATGHGDTIRDLLHELRYQLQERRRTHQGGE